MAQLASNFCVIRLIPVYFKIIHTYTRFYLSFIIFNNLPMAWRCLLWKHLKIIKIYSLQATLIHKGHRKRNWQHSHHLISQFDEFWPDQWFQWWQETSPDPYSWGSWWPITRWKGLSRWYMGTLIPWVRALVFTLPLLPSTQRAQRRNPKPERRLSTTPLKKEKGWIRGGGTLKSHSQHFWATSK